MLQLLPSNLLQLIEPTLQRSRPYWPRLQRVYSSRADGPPVPPQHAILDSLATTMDARDWIARFKRCTLLRSDAEFSFSRSSGPGGQNVNKVNTKATLRLPLNTRWVPLWAHPALKDSPAYTASSQSILITSTVFRSQTQNVDDCLTKLHKLIHGAAAGAIKNEPTQEQQKRVGDFVKADQARRKIMKSKRSEVKKSRGKGGWD